MFMLPRFLNMCLGRSSVDVLLKCQVFWVLYFTFWTNANWDIVQQLAEFVYVCGV